MKQLPYWGPTNIRWHHIKFSWSRNLTPGISAPLLCQINWQAVIVKSHDIWLFCNTVAKPQKSPCECFNILYQQHSSAYTTKYVLSCLWAPQLPSKCYEKRNMNPMVFRVLLSLAIQLTLVYTKFSKYTNILPLSMPHTLWECILTHSEALLPTLLTSH
jgi:hypothetical protein